MKRTVLATSLLLALAACGGGGGSAPAVPTPPAPPPTITLSTPPRVMMAGGLPAVLTASVSSSASVSWSLGAGSPGLLSASTGNTVNYQPPTQVAAVTEVTVTASAGGASKSFTFTLYPDPGAAGLRAVAGAQWQEPGMVDGSGAAASFSSLQAIASDGNGGYVVMDRSDAQIAVRKVSAAGAVSTLWVGETLPENHNTYLPKLAVASDGAVWLLEERIGNRRLRRINAAGQGMTVLENIKFSDGSEIQPATDSAVYLISTSAVRRVTQEGAISAFAGILTDGSRYDTPRVDGTGAAAQFNLIWGTASDRAGNLVVNDNGVLRRVSAGAKVSTIATPGLDSASIHSLAGSADGSTFISNNSGLLKLAADNTLSTLLPAQGIGRFIGASNDGGVALAVGRELRQLASGKLLPLAGVDRDTHIPLDGAPAVARFDQPSHIAADAAGNIYVTDTPGMGLIPSALGFGPGGMVIRKIAPDGTVSTLMGDKTFDVRSGMVADRAGNLYVSESRTPHGRIEVLGGAIYKVTPTGVMSVFAGVRPDGVNNHVPPADGTGTAARFVGPAIVGMDAEENIYVSDKTYYGNQASLRKITPAGVVSTITALPAGLGAALDGNIYQPRGTTIVRIAPDGKESVVMDKLKAPSAVVQLGPYSFGVLDSGQVLKLVLPH